MQPTEIASSVFIGVVDFVASTKFGQFLLKKFDKILRTFEKPAQYSVHRDAKKIDNSELPWFFAWLLFWIVLFHLKIFRAMSSTILIIFDKNPIEWTDIVKYLQKWRRTLRCIRFRGLRMIMEQRNRTSNGNGGKSLDC